MTTYAPDPDCIPGWIPAAPGQIHPGTPGSGGTPGSYCPSSWEEDFDRAQMSTQVIIGRTTPQNIPELRYIFPADTGPLPPATGEFVMNNNQEAATWIYFARTADVGGDVTIWLRCLWYSCTILIQTLADTKESRSYFVTGDPVVYSTYIAVPISWTQGTDPIPHGPVDVQLGIIAKPPQVWQDSFGVNHYGRISFQRTDLINVDEDLFSTLADRILEVRGSNSVPRLAAVTMDARQGPPGYNMRLMSTADPGRPSRYRCCMQVNDRVIFHRMCFVTSIRHFITRSEWTLRIGLDMAEWAGTL